MRIKFLFSVFWILAGTACVDRIYFDVGSPQAFSLVVDGNISQLPGPYFVQLSKAFDIESKNSLRLPVSAKSVVISDNTGVQEVLSEVSTGYYQTNPQGIRGVVGKSYKLTVELIDGRVYESIPDTLLSPGKLDSVYAILKEAQPGDLGPRYGYDIFFSSSGGGSATDHFLWKYTGTFRADTNPELNHDGCVFYNGKCNYVPLCSGYRNVSTSPRLIEAIYVKVEPCTCCTCWYTRHNLTAILSDDQLIQKSNFQEIYIANVPIDPWIFKNKIVVDVSQLRLSDRAYRFWKAVRNQAAAVNSLFQPVSGRIIGNMVQVSGTAVSVEGLFLATGVSQKTIVLTRDMLPPPLIPDSQTFYADICQNLFPNSTLLRPSFWVD